jgi:hypothetical protein
MGTGTGVDSGAASAAEEVAAGGFACNEVSLPFESAAPPHAVRDNTAANNAGRVAGGGCKRFLSLPADEARVFIAFLLNWSASALLLSFYLLVSQENKIFL